MKEKLEREYVRGFQDGQQHVNEEMLKLAENHGFLKGSHETWRMVEEMIPKLKGIGPKTADKVLKAVQEYVRDKR